jgi:histidinol phosphatase-like enzyme
MAKPKQPPIAAIDLDGTILEYDGWKGPAHFGKPVAGIIDELGTLKREGWAIVIWTCRANDFALKAHLEKYQVPYDYINKHPWQPPGSSHKVYADVYVDDRGLRFNGTSQGLAERIIANKHSWVVGKTAATIPSYEEGPERHLAQPGVDVGEKRFRMSQLVLGKNQEANETNPMKTKPSAP